MRVDKLALRHAFIITKGCKVHQPERPVAAGIPVPPPGSAFSLAARLSTSSMGVSQLVINRNPQIYSSVCHEFQKWRPCESARGSNKSFLQSSECYSIRSEIKSDCGGDDVAENGVVGAYPSHVRCDDTSDAGACFPRNKLEEWIRLEQLHTWIRQSIFVLQYPECPEDLK